MATVPEYSEHGLDLAAVLVESFVLFDIYLSVLLGRYARIDTFAFQSSSEPIGIVPAIRQKMLGERQFIGDPARAFVITHLAV